MEAIGRWAVLDAPSNLGLRPTGVGLVPGCYQAPGVLRDAGLVSRLNAIDAGGVTPGRYIPGWAPGTVGNEAAIAEHSSQLADNVGDLLDRSCRPVVLGGDCSILVGIGLALQRAGRLGLVSLDGLDYRHSGNTETSMTGAVAGESLALVTGLGGRLADLGGRRPYLRAEDVVAVGVRPGDEYADEAVANGLHVLDVPTVAGDPETAAARVLALMDRAGLKDFWVHLDADVLDPTLMPAVDSPEPGGLTFEVLTLVLRRLMAVPGAIGMDVTIYDPDLDPDLRHGRRLADTIVSALVSG